MHDDTEQCPHCNGYGSSLNEDSDRCTRCGVSGLIPKTDTITISTGQLHRR
jgi:DnaJ-class molecular chaperone